MARRPGGRHFCTHECFLNSLKGGTAPEKRCAACGKRMTPRRMKGNRLEGKAEFGRRKYCDRACMSVGLRKARPTIAAARKRAKHFRGSACEVCRRTDRLHAHHINGNVHDNRAANIQTLCAFCHGQHHADARAQGRAIAGRMEVLV